MAWPAGTLAATWTTTAGNWGVGGNWDNGTPPDSTDAVASFIAASAGISEPVGLRDASNNPSVFTVGTLNITGASTGGFSFYDGEIAFRVSSGNALMDVDTSLNRILDSVTVSLFSDTEFAISATSVVPFFVFGNITGGGSLTKTGAGTMRVLDTDNNYTGGTNVRGGTLDVFTGRIDHAMADLRIGIGAADEGTMTVGGGGSVTARLEVIS